jgi:hypothetical protein
MDFAEHLFPTHSGEESTVPLLCGRVSNGSTQRPWWRGDRKGGRGRYAGTA